MSNESIKVFWLVIGGIISILGVTRYVVIVKPEHERAEMLAEKMAQKARRVEEYFPHLYAAQFVKGCTINFPYVLKRPYPSLKEFDAAVGPPDSSETEIRDDVQITKDIWRYRDTRNNWKYWHAEFILEGSEWRVIRVIENFEGVAVSRDPLCAKVEILHLP